MSALVTVARWIFDFISLSNIPLLLPKSFRFHFRGRKLRSPLFSQCGGDPSNTFYFHGPRAGRSLRTLVRKQLAHQCQGFLFGMQASFKLRVFNRREDLLEARARLVAGCDQVVAADKRLRSHDLRWNR